MDRIDVHRNLNKEGVVWSVKDMTKGSDDYGLVKAHVEHVRIAQVEFIVQPAGNKKVKETGVKNVHAFARGYNMGMFEKQTDNIVLLSSMAPVYYDPEKHDTFMCRGEPIYSSYFVILSQQGCFAQCPSKT